MMNFYKTKKTADGIFIVRCRWRPIVVGIQFLMLPAMIAAVVIVLCILGGCHTIQTGPGCDLTPYNDSMTTQMGFMLIDQLPRLLR